MAVRKKKNNEFLLKIGLVVITFLLTIAGQQLFFKNNTEFTSKSDLKKEMIIRQYEYLNRILYFARLNQENGMFDITTIDSCFTRYRTIKKTNIGIIELTDTLFNQTKTKFTQVDTTKEYIVVPAITMFQNRLGWDSLCKIIEKDKNLVDNNIYLQFVNIYDFIKYDHPLFNNKDSVLVSGWSSYYLSWKIEQNRDSVTVIKKIDNSIVKEWTRLNKELENSILKFIQLDAKE